MELYAEYHTLCNLSQELENLISLTATEKALGMCVLCLKKKVSKKGEFISTETLNNEGELWHWRDVSTERK